MRKPPAPAPAPAPAPGQGKRGIEGHLTYLLRQANAAVRLKLERSLEDLDVTMPQFVVLTMLRAYPGLSGADLARVAVLTPQTVGTITRNLESLGAISRTPHPSHGRVLQFTLTDEGAELLETCRKRIQTVERVVGKDLSPEREAVVRAWLVGLAER